MNGRKIVGSAQRRVSGAFLQHGSILLDYGPPLEAGVIPGGCPGYVVTSINRELGREISVTEVKAAFKKAFSQALATQFNQ